jgi:alkylation response protein AidB-like acyl-CoA dehydrogenase
MAREYISMQNLKYLLYDVHGIDRLLSHPRYAHIGGREELDLLLDSAKDLADREMFPWFKEMDQKPVVHSDGRIHSHPQLKNIFKAAAEAGWFSATTDLSDGGTQLPYSVFSSAHLIFQAANNAAQGYLGVSTGALDLITSFGDEKLKKTFMQPMMDGRWQGTMALTEPQAGSSLSDITTSAEPDGKGGYRITGQKIFISAGEHEACENFIHLTLARIKGAPAGTKGISLFAVPKYLPSEDGSLAPNHLDCVADFQKMGQRGYATTHLVFGERGDTIGFLVGEANKGLSYMFQMMNAARIVVGQTAAAVASAAYYNALQYANERPQGRLVSDKDLNRPQTLIINHADVRRMLMLQKAIVEGSLSLVVECLRWHDLEKVSEGEEKERAWLILELLTPIVKTYPSEEGLRSISNALQVFGGYGFTMDFDAQQYYRDVRIMSIYEGTTGIQSMDLLGRKVTVKDGKALIQLGQEVLSTIRSAETYEPLQPYAKECETALMRLQGVIMKLQDVARKEGVEAYLSDANLFMEMAGLLCVAWQWLKQGLVSTRALQGDPAEGVAAFHRSKVHTMRFFFKYELPKVNALADSLCKDERLTLKGGEEVLM